MKSAFSLLSPAGRRGRLQIFIFHRVLPARDPLFPGEMTVQDFDAACRWLREWFQVLPLDAAVRALRDGRLPQRAAAITFDDGYADNHDQALPILQRHGLSATFFVATAFLDGGRMWNDTIIEAVRGCRADALRFEPAGIDEAMPLGGAAQRRALIERVIGHAKYLPPAQRQVLVDEFAARCAAPLPTDLMMSSEQVRRLRRAGQLVGAHTASHPILARLPRDEAEREIRLGREALQALLDEPVALFAYPNGKPGQDYRDETVAIVRELGFDAAVSTAWGAASADSDCFQLPRFTPWDRTRGRFALRLVRNYLGW